MVPAVKFKQPPCHQLQVSQEPRSLQRLTNCLLPLPHPMFMVCLFVMLTEILWLKQNIFHSPSVTEQDRDSHRPCWSPSALAHRADRGMCQGYTVSSHRRVSGQTPHTVLRGSRRGHSLYRALFHWPLLLSHRLATPLLSETFSLCSRDRILSPAPLIWWSVYGRICCTWLHQWCKRLKNRMISGTWSLFQWVFEVAQNSNKIQVSSLFFSLFNSLMAQWTIT